jgi:glutamate/tyrosine decarboxylase-like PLP-dependent enzyme
LFANSEEHAFLRRLNVGGEAYIYKDDQDARRQALAAAGQEFVDNNDNLGYRRIEGSMGGQGASALYNTIKYIGKHGIKLLLDHTLDLTTTFVDEIRAQDGGLKLSFDPHLNQVCVEPTVEDPENARWVEETSARLQTDFGIYLSTTSLPVDGLLDSSGKPVKKKVFRFIATHPHTTDDDIRDIADKLNETWEAVVHGK